MHVEAREFAACPVWRQRREDGGFTYVGMLFAIAVLMSGLAGVGEVWHSVVQRSKEAELIFIGGEFKRAIESYYLGAPAGEAKQYPRTLEDLVLDTRQPAVVRHLRKIYVDPMTAGTEWGLVKVGDRIVGVYSTSDKLPFRRSSSAEGVQDKYSDWKFVAEVSAVANPRLGDR